MSLKQQIETWAKALEAYEAQDFEQCLQLFETIADESKILFNIGLIQATVGAHEEAVQNFEAAISMDQYLAVAYFQSGVSNFLLGRYPEARRDFDDTYSYLRSNLTIDYEQLGLKFRLYSCEVLFNRGLASIYMGQEAQGMSDFTTAMKEKQTDEHGVIDEAYADRGDGYTVFSIPVGVLYRPSDNKLKNLKAKNYLGKATLVAASDARDAFVGFTGATLANRTNERNPNVGGVFGEDGKGAGSLSRAKTATARMESLPDPVAPLRRANTALPTPTRSNTAPVGGMPMPPPRGLGRSLNTSANGPRGGGRSPGPSPISRSPPRVELSGLPTPPSSDEMLGAGQRDTAYGGTELIDSYYDVSGGSSSVPPVPQLPSPYLPPTPEGQPIDRVAKWARQNVGAPPPQVSLSRSSSANETGSIPKKPVVLMRSNTVPAPSAYGSTMMSRTELEDEGTIVSEREMNKVRIKLRFNGDTRGMSISPTMRLVDFEERVRRKFERENDMIIKYKDAEGAMVSIMDADDWESAMDEARENSKGRAEGKLEIWVSEG
ncbi:hypothetical protein T439DRAFT_310458 [Meredithblackwellia eburnea MCA 4105]